jgi:hypothetical protein
VLDYAKLVRRQVNRCVHGGQSHRRRQSHLFRVVLALRKLRNLAEAEARSRRKSLPEYDCMHDAPGHERKSSSDTDTAYE